MDISFGHLRNRMSLTVKILLLATVAAVAFSWRSASANPDVWVKTEMNYRFVESRITAISFEWQFDEYFSSRTIEAFDVNQNGTLEQGEIEHLRHEAFNPLKKFDYYVHVWVAGKKRTKSEIVNFTANVDNNRLVYRFTMALTPPADPGSGAVVASLYDKTYHVDFKFKKQKFILVEGAMSPNCKFQIKRGSGAMSGHRQPVTLRCGE